MVSEEMKETKEAEIEKETLKRVKRERTNMFDSGLKIVREKITFLF